jgi:hypothetical protein
VQNDAAHPGISLAERPAMGNCFMAGAEMVRWELTAVAANGPFRLTVHHSQGTITEYFEQSAAALAREQEIEGLLIAARGTAR